MALIKLTSVPLRHSDAVGYLTDLAGEVNQQWFSMICDLVVASVSRLTSQDIEVLFALCKEKASYVRSAPLPGATLKQNSDSRIDFLEELSGFTNFKLLSDTLSAIFTKRITLIFGTNGSGKSSLCECFKILANADIPVRPLQNVRAGTTSVPSFCFKFRTDSATQTWSNAVGYGYRKDVIKYFDSGTAITSVENPVWPGRLIELTPFKLHVFELAMTLTASFRDAVRWAKKKNALELTTLLQGLREDVSKFGRHHPWTSTDSAIIRSLPDALRLAETFAGGRILKERRSAAAELEKATSDAGLRLLKAEHHELQAFLRSLQTLLDSVHRFWALEPAAMARTVADKRHEQEILGKALIPDRGGLQDLLVLLRAAERLCDFEATAGQSCPLCKRSLDQPEIELFRHYHGLLTNKIEKDIVTITKKIDEAAELLRTIQQVDPQEWEKSATLSAEILSVAKSNSDLLLLNCSLDKEPAQDAKDALDLLKKSFFSWTDQLKVKESVIKTAEADTQELREQLETISSEIGALEYYQFLAEQRERLDNLRSLFDETGETEKILAAFPPLQKKITDRAKQAHNELIVADFEKRLNAEYKALTDREMHAFGVKLKNIGDDAVVTLTPEIGDHQINNVLSDGEQRVHALALFLAELETSPQSVLVFDDPISSFDYNYVSSFCMRLRDFANTHKSRQLIILTHNWEFFVHLQTSLNRAGLNNQLSVQVLENCSKVGEYSEEIDELKKAIDIVLAVPGEPHKRQKEELAGNLRRLIEATVNTHVFNRQRHQYKQKTQTVSNFQDFTKLVPLEAAEAATLRDLFELLSVPEHSDPRNAYVNTDKVTFQGRYNQILAVEAALISRR